MAFLVWPRPRGSSRSLFTSHFPPYMLIPAVNMIFRGRSSPLDGNSDSAVNQLQPRQHIKRSAAQDGSRYLPRFPIPSNPIKGQDALPNF